MLCTRIGLFFVIFCSIQLQYVNGTTQESQESQRFNKDLLFTGKKSFEDGNFIFAVCDKNSPSLTECHVVQRVYEIKGDAHRCKIILKGDRNESILSISIGVATLGKDKAILFWEDVHDNTTTTKIGTIDLKTCKMNEVKIDDPNREVIMYLYSADKMVTYEDDSFDIFINDPNRFGNKLGKMEINGDGTAKGEPVPSNIKAGHGLISYLSTIATRSSSKGYTYLKEDDTEFTLLLVKSDGSEMQLEKYAKTRHPIVAASENIVSACTEAKDDTGVTCSQYDENGKVKVTTTIPAMKNTQPKAIHNLPGGGMLVMLAEPKQCEQQSSCNGRSKHRIVKIAADGKVMGSAHNEDFDNVTSQWELAYVYKFDESEYCGAIIGENPTNLRQKPNDFKMIHLCFTENEFSI